MSEQQRVFVAVALCLGILLAWQMFVPKPPPPKQAPPATEQPAAPAAAPSGATGPAVDSAPAVAPTAVAAEAGAGEPAAAPAVVEIPETRRAFETDQFSAELSNRDASLTRFELKRYQERAAKEGTEPHPVSLVNAGTAPRQARVLWDLGGVKPPQLAWEEAADGGFAFKGTTPEGLTTRVRVQPREGAYALDYELVIENATGGAAKVGANVELSLLPLPQKKKSMFGMFAPPVGQLQGACAVDGSVEREHPNDLLPGEDGPYTSPMPAAWGGIDRQYFAVALLPAESQQVSCVMRATPGANQADKSGEETLYIDLGFGNEPLGDGARWSRKFTVYLGPKRQQALVAVSPLLGDVIDYTWGIPLGFIARPMIFLLNAFQGFTGSWGVAIMLLTLLVKLLLFPITYKSIVSMRRMQLLKPELDKLKTQFADDRERQQMEQMKLFREKGVNPLGGCLPMLLQMPVWVALYRTLWSAVDLYQQPFLWLADLTAAEPLPIMALLVGGLMFLQQKMTPTSVDSQQAKMMLYIMPIMFTFFMLGLPSGLVLYILVNSVLTLIQQLVINRRTVAL